MLTLSDLLFVKDVDNLSCSFVLPYYSRIINAIFTNNTHFYVI